MRCRGVDERALVQALRERDGQALAAACASYRPVVFTFLVRLSGDRALAQDLCQETFIRLARFADRLQADTRLKPWLLTVARNLYRSHCRWRWLDGERLVELAAKVSDKRSAVVTPHDALANEQARTRIEAAMARLRPAEREVVLLASLGMDGPGVAEVLGVTEEAGRQRLSRARASFKRLLDEQGEAP